MRNLLLASLLLAGTVGSDACATEPWKILPPTPALPAPLQSGLAPVNGIKLWYACFGSGPPVILLHGGLANANYWGNQVPVLARNHRVIVVDSRGHGRSTRNTQPFGYDLMASDILGLMDDLHVQKAAVVGWSDGAILGLDMAIHHPERLTGVFAFAANSDPSGVKDVEHDPVFSAYIRRAGAEYRALSPTPGEYDEFVKQIETMWRTQPHFTAAELGGIQVPVWIVDADHDEAIKRDNTLFMADAIPNAGLLIQPDASHFAFLQDPGLFNAEILDFLERVERK
jgi:pimeloyl-ACP methyl ester carboxylesterase